MLNTSLNLPLFVGHSAMSALMLVAVALMAFGLEKFAARLAAAGASSMLVWTVHGLASLILVYDAVQLAIWIVKLNP